ncbi:Transcription elongation factor 1 [Babesia sp. Xinjiang]|uniref:Transcription elongation factor 1 n=1 Tax=Babesia sp. Xinjiang TaxID=462227 RepID=UPI000A242BE7|nr:Transcription elongation factor 1 [Babesia sp. Xinjiang]ORM41232.1 Transcription elongation factor 1 [Babesia sp. Xinjiang]
MAKRKTKKVQLSRTQLMQKRRGKLEKEFLCYYCQHEKSVAIKIDNQSGVGLLSCRICGVKFSTRVTVLDEAVDVYSLWMDSCREGQHAEGTPPKEDDEPFRSQHRSMETIRHTSPTPVSAPPISQISGVRADATPANSESHSNANAEYIRPRYLDNETTFTELTTLTGASRSKNNGRLIYTSWFACHLNKILLLFVSVVKFYLTFTVLDVVVSIDALWIYSCYEVQQDESTPTQTVDAPLRSQHRSVETIIHAAPTPVSAPPISQISGVRADATPANSESHSNANAEYIRPRYLDNETTFTELTTLTGASRSKRIIDAADDTISGPELVAGTLTRDSLFEED